MAAEQVHELGFDPDALRERYRARARQAAARRRRRPVHRDGRARSPATPRTTPTSTRRSRASRSPTRSTIAIIGGGFSGLLAGARLTEQGVTTSASSRPAATSAARGTGTAIPARSATPSRTATCRCSKSSATCRRRSTPTSPRSSSTPSASASTTASTSKTCFQTRVRSIDWDERAAALAHHDEPRRRHQGPVRRSWRSARPRRAKLPGIPGIDDVRGPLVPHQPLGLRLHRRRHERRDDRSSPTSGSPIIGTGATAIQCVPRVAQDAEHLYVFQRTPSSVDWRGNKPTDPEWWAVAGAGLAARAARELRRHGRRPARRGRPDRRRLDRHLPQRRQLAEGREPAEDEGGAQPRRRARRLHEDEQIRAARRRDGRAIRTPPRR